MAVCHCPMRTKGADERSMAAGMDRYLTKPIRAEELDAVLFTYVRRKRELPGLLTAIIVSPG
jgi:DNA-binding response OmpR family regulator